MTNNNIKDMGKNFQEILNSYLDEKDQNPNKKAEEIIKTVNTKEGVDPSRLDTIMEQCKQIDELSADYKDLQQSINEGMSKEKWIENSLEEVTKGLTEEQREKVQSAILKGLDQFAQYKFQETKVDAQNKSQETKVEPQTTKKDDTVTTK